MSYLDRTENIKLTAFAYGLLREIYMNQGNYEQSLIYADSIYQIDLVIGDTIFIAEALSFIGRINSLIGRKKESLSYFHESLALLENNKLSAEYSIALNAMGLGQMNLNEFEKADKFITDALHISQAIQDTVFNYE